MDRRRFLLGLGATLVSLAVDRAEAAMATDLWSDLRLWDGEPPGGGGPSGPPKISAKGAWSRVGDPILKVLSPQHPTGRAVLIAAGGGYTRIENGKEAEPAARWLVGQGYTAYVLIYRLPGEGWSDGPLVALQDAQRALRIIRQRERKVSVLGFSAGGHLLGLAALRSDFQAYAPRQSLDREPAVADGAALIYPVVTLQAPYTHTSVHRVLVGPGASAAMAGQWSLQTHVSRHSPPFFLVQAEDDATSDPENTRILAAACRSAGVAVDMIRYPVGGHGFGMGRSGTPTIEWPVAYADWLRQLSA